MSKKRQADLIVMIVLFLSALIVIVSGVHAFDGNDAGSLFTGASIMFAAALITRAMQWASDGKDE